jgi:hypothetical protein
LARATLSGGGVGGRDGRAHLGRSAAANRPVPPRPVLRQTPDGSLPCIRFSTLTRPGARSKSGRRARPRALRLDRRRRGHRGRRRGRCHQRPALVRHRGPARFERAREPRPGPGRHQKAWVGRGVHILAARVARPKERSSFVCAGDEPPAEPPRDSPGNRAPSSSWIGTSASSACGVRRVWFSAATDSRAQRSSFTGTFRTLLSLRAQPDSSPPPPSRPCARAPPPSPEHRPRTPTACRLTVSQVRLRVASTSTAA